MKTTSKVVSFSILLLIVISVSLSMMAPQALAKQAAVHMPNQSSPPDATISIQPDFLPVQLTFDQNGNVSFGLSKTIEIEELGFVVNISTSQLIPQLSS